MKSVTTTDLAEFGYTERKEMTRLLNEWNEFGLPEGFYKDEVRVMFNKNSGYVFLTNSDYQTAMMNGNKLEVWFNCPNCGHEGFAEDCQIDDENQCCNECKGE
jgi:hypothetical protein